MRLRPRRGVLAVAAITLTGLAVPLGEARTALAVQPGGQAGQARDGLSPGDSGGARGGRGRVPAQDVPPKKRMTPGGDELGYAPMPLPYTDYPLARSAGGIFNSEDDTGPGCSAAAIQSASGLLVLTAAHCVLFDPDHNATFFRPAFNKWATTTTPWSQRPEAPYGDWRITDIYAPTHEESQTLGEGGSDIAIVKVAPREVEGVPRTLSETVGGFTPVLNPLGRYRFYLLGYPATAGYSNREMYRCLGRVRPDRDPEEGTTLLTNNCHAVGGNSGGPFVMARYRGGYGIVGALTGAPDPYVRGAGSADAAPTMDKSFGKLLARADPEGVANAKYDQLDLLGGESYANPELVKRGKRLSYRFMVGLEGEISHANVPVTIELSRGQRFVKATSGTCKPDGSPRRLRCSISLLWTGDDEPVGIRVATSKNAPKQVSATARVHPSKHLNPEPPQPYTLKATTYK